MALNARFYCSLCDILFVNSENNKLAGTSPRAFIKYSGSFFILSVFFCISTPVFSLVIILTSVFAIQKSINKNFQQAIKLALELFFQSQKLGQNQAKAN